MENTNNLTKLTEKKMTHIDLKKAYDEKSKLKEIPRSKRLVIHLEWVENLVYGRLPISLYISHIENDAKYIINRKGEYERLIAALTKSYDEMDTYFDGEYQMWSDEVDVMEGNIVDIDLRLFQLVEDFDKYTITITKAIEMFTRRKNVLEVE